MERNCARDVSPRAKVALAGALLILFGTVCSIMYSVWLYREWRLCFECQRNIAGIRRALDETDWDKDAQGRPLWPLVLEGVPSHLLVCPKCGKRYVYSPVLPSGDGIPFENGDIAVMWCPLACHRGRRVVMMQNAVGYLQRDEEVDWSTQEVKRTE